MKNLTKYGEGVEIHAREDIDKVTAELRIDDIIRDYWSRREIRPHFRTEQHALGFGRRTLQVGIHQCFVASEELLRGAWRDEWQEAEEWAKRGQKALSGLLKFMIGDTRPPTTTDLLPQLRHMAIITRAERGEKADLVAAVGEAQANAETLIAAAALLREMTAFNGKKGDHLAGGGNPGNPVKAAFVLTMAQGWLCLTGAMPSTHTTMTNNPFMKFAAAGWVDAGGSLGNGETLESVNSFGQSAITNARLTLSEEPYAAREDYRPSWA